MAGATEATGITPEMVKVAETAVARPAGLAADSVETQVILDVNKANLVEGYNIMSGRQADYPAIDKLVQNNIGYKDHAGVVQRTTAEGTLYNEANGTNGIIPLLKDYAEKGIDHCSANAKSYLIDNYAQIILSSPQQANRFVGMTPTNALIEAKRIAEVRLKNPLIQRQVAESIPSKADISRPIEDKVTPADAELHRLEVERDKAKTAYDGTDGAKGKYDKKELQVREYTAIENPTHPGTFVDQGKLAKIKQLDIDRSAAEAERKNLDDVVIPGLDSDLTQLTRELQQSLEALNSAAAAKATDVNAYLGKLGLRPVDVIQKEINDPATGKQKELKTARAELTKKIREIKEKETEANQLKEEKQRYETELKELETKKEKAKEAYDKAQEVYDKQKINRDNLHKEKETAEAQWVDQLRKIVPDIASADLQKEMQLAVNKAKERMDKRAIEEKDGGKKKFWEYERLQYIGPDGKPRKTTINADRVALMRAGTDFTFTWGTGVNAKTEKLYLDGAQQTLVDVMTRGGMGHEQIYNLLKDPTTSTEMSVALAQDILTTFLWSGGRLNNPGEILAIQRTDWGKGMVTKAMAGRADLQAQVDAVIGKDVLNWKDNLGEQLKKIDWKKFLLILLIIAGIIGGVSLLKK